MGKIIFWFYYVYIGVFFMFVYIELDKILDLKIILVVVEREKVIFFCNFFMKIESGDL